jgi:drug/metabolite transporter (DMT)-like permease
MAMPAAAESISKNLRGMLLMVLAGLFFASMHASIRFVSAEIHPFEIAFFRNLLNAVVLLPVLWRADFSRLKTKRLRMHVARGIVQGTSVLVWFSALALIPLAEATALNFLSPLIAVGGAALILREAVSARSWFAIAVGFVGMLIIIRPGIEVVSLGAILAIASATLLGTSKMMAKSLTAMDSSTTIVAYTALVATPLTFIAALFFWAWPSAGQLAWLILVGLLGTGAHLAMIQAYRCAALSSVEPLSYVRMLWAALFGFLVFGEIPEIWTWVGSALIILGAIIVTARKANSAP